MTAKVGLAIGCGGTLGGAWAIAALAALHEQTSWDPRSASVLQGTSAGAEIVTMLAAGYGVHDLVDMQQGITTDPVLRGHIESTPPSVPTVPLPLPTCAASIRHRGIGGHGTIAGLAPRGRGDSAWLQRLADALADADGWVPNPAARLVAFEPRAGRRAAFGAPGQSRPGLGDALRASWAVPGWMRPVTIEGKVYIDGGAASTASVDLVSPAEVDTLVVIAPMASTSGQRAAGVAGVVEDRLLRRPMARTLRAEVDQARRRGIRVIPILPGESDMNALGWNFMARRRRPAAFTRALETARRTVDRALSVDGESLS